MFVRDPLISFAVLSSIAMGGHKRSMGFWHLLFFRYRLIFLCLLALKLRSLHIQPPHLCRFAVFQYKPTLSLSNES